MSESVLRASRRAMARGSRSFYLASRLLPGPVRDSVQLLYAWCRHCDDAIDGQVSGHGGPPPDHDPRSVLARLTAATEQALADGPVTGMPFAALRHVTRAHGIPPWYVRQHLAGFAMDADGVRPSTLDDTVAYSYRVAGVVGVMIAWVMGVRDRPTLERAADLGIAFQLTNISRDVLDDAKAGRVYLPEELLRAEGIDASRVAVPEDRAAVARAVARLLDEAEKYYVSSETGIARLPLRLAWSIESARRVYREIGREARRRGPAAWDRRVVIPLAEKLALMARAAAGLLARRAPDDRAVASRSGLWQLPHPPGPDTAGGVAATQQGA